MAGDIRYTYRQTLDLDIDSLERIELHAHIERVLNIRLGDEIASQTFTVRDLFKAVARELSGRDGVGGMSTSPTAVTWNEIIISASADDLAERHVIETTAFARAARYPALKLAFLIAKILFRLKVSGPGHLPRERPFLICPNHQSYMDGALVASVPPSAPGRRTATGFYSPRSASPSARHWSLMIKRPPITSGIRNTLALQSKSATRCATRYSIYGRKKFSPRW
jgi:hypothetical protein